MKIDVDYARCEGHDLCAAQAPALFSLDDEGEMVYNQAGSVLPDSMVGQARVAVASCPVAALRELP